MAGIRELSKVAAKWTEVTPQRSGQYKDGVLNPKKDWATEAAKAEPAYKTAVAAASARGAYGAGVKGCGTSRQQQKAAEKGPSRFAEGVMTGGADYEKGFSPFHSVIKATELPPRGPRGDVANLNRVSIISKALNAKRLELSK